MATNPFRLSAEQMLQQALLRWKAANQIPPHQGMADYQVVEFCAFITRGYADMAARLQELASDALHCSTRPILIANGEKHGR